jgi:hypothetical protein
METWDVPPPTGTKLADSANDINPKVNHTIDALKGLKPPSLEKTVYERLGKPVPPKLYLAPIETWANALTEATSTTEGLIYNPRVEDTVYKDDSESKVFGLAPIMLVAGHYIGTDKIGHFFQLGYAEYYAKTLGPKGLSRDQAIAEGNKTEEGGFGLNNTGVYSHADIAANVAGMGFYNELGKGGGNFAFDIRKYVSDKWNEQKNSNAYGGRLSDLPRKQLDGNWRGTIFWADGSSAPCQVSLKTSLSYSLKLGDADIEGTYTYAHPKAAHTTGHLKGTASPVRDSNSGGGIVGLTLALDWQEGAAAGKATFKTVGFNVLDGSWTRGSAGGDWKLTKV